MGTNTAFIEIKLDTRALGRLERQLRTFPKAMPKVMSRSINKALTSARVVATNEITKDINLTKTRTKRAMVLTKATYARWVGKIHFQKRRIRIIFFGASPTNKGVTYKIRKKKGRKLIPGAFITTVRKGQKAENRGVFARKFVKGSKSKRVARYSIIQQRGPSMGSILKEDEVIKAKVTRSAAANFTKFIVAQVNLIFERGR